VRGCKEIKYIFYIGIEFLFHHVVITGIYSVRNSNVPSETPLERFPPIFVSKSSYGYVVSLFPGSDDVSNEPTIWLAKLKTETSHFGPKISNI
jgi:hypothetical protein